MYINSGNFLLFQNCLEDINEAIKNGYPSTTLHKLDIRQANCCYRLQDWDGASRGRPLVHPSRSDYSHNGFGLYECNRVDFVNHRYNLAKFSA